MDKQYRCSLSRLLFIILEGRRKEESLDYGLTHCGAYHSGCIYDTAAQ